MKRAIFAMLMLATVGSSTGCCAVKDLFCSIPVAGRLCGNKCGPFCGPPVHHRACKSGCGETYWGECISDRVACHDPCDRCGNWCGPQTEYPGYLPPGYGDYSAGPISSDEGEVIYDGPVNGRLGTQPPPPPAPSTPSPQSRRQGPARSAMQRMTAPEPIPDPRMSQMQRRPSPHSMAQRP